MNVISKCNNSQVDLLEWNEMIIYIIKYIKAVTLGKG